MKNKLVFVFTYVAAAVKSRFFSSFSFFSLEVNKTKKYATFHVTEKTHQLLVVTSLYLTVTSKQGKKRHISSTLHLLRRKGHMIIVKLLYILRESMYTLTRITFLPAAVTSRMQPSNGHNKVVRE